MHARSSASASAPIPDCKPRTLRGPLHPSRSPDELPMKAAICASTLLTVFALLTPLNARADEYDDTMAIFKKAGQSGTFFAKSYGSAVLPTIGRGGLGVGAAHGKGRVYAKGQPIGETTMNQVSVGLQAGGQAFSQIIFFADQRALEEFTSGSFEFGANVQA